MPGFLVLTLTNVCEQKTYCNMVSERTRNLGIFVIIKNYYKMMSQNAGHCVLTMSEAQFNQNLSKDTIRKTGYKCIDENENKNY